MINEGISELLFTSDGIKQMEASYYPELLGGKKEDVNSQKSFVSWKTLWINFSLQKYPLIILSKVLHAHLRMQLLHT